MTKVASTRHRRKGVPEFTPGEARENPYYPTTRANKRLSQAAERVKLWTCRGEFLDTCRRRTKSPGEKIKRKGKPRQPGGKGHANTEF